MVNSYIIYSIIPYKVFCIFSCCCFPAQNPLTQSSLKIHPLFTHSGVVPLWLNDQAKINTSWEQMENHLSGLFWYLHLNIVHRNIISNSCQTNMVSSSYRAGGRLERPRRAADAIAVVTVVGGQAGRAGGEWGGHRQCTAWSGWLGHTAAVIVHVVVLKRLERDK